MKHKFKFKYKKKLLQRIQTNKDNYQKQIAKEGLISDLNSKLITLIHVNYYINFSNNNNEDYNINTEKN